MLILYVIAILNTEVMKLFTESTIHLGTEKILVWTIILFYTFINIIYYVISIKQLNKGINID